MRTRPSLLLILLILFGALSPLGAPTTHAEGDWDLIRDFDPNFNPAPGSTWQYGWKASVTGTFEAFWERGTHPDGVPYWWNSSSTANIWKNTSSQTQYGIVPGQVSIHPGLGGKYTTVRWTAPTRTAVAVDAEFGAGDNGRFSGWGWVCLW